MSRGCTYFRALPCALLALAVLLMAPTWVASAQVEVRMLLDTAPLGDTFVYDVDPASR